MKTEKVTSWRKSSDILLEPLTLQELKDKSTKQGILTSKLLVGLDELIDGDIDDLNDTVSERITGSCCGLTDISYEPMGSVRGNIVLRVTGNVADHIANEEEYNEEDYGVVT